MKPTAVYEDPDSLPVFNPADFIGKDSRFYFRLESVGDTITRRASVFADDAAYVRPALVSNQACQNCHGTFAGTEAAITTTRSMRMPAWLATVQ